MRSGRGVFAGAVAVAVALLASCASMKQTVRVAPVSGPVPISASSSLYVDGRVIAESQLTVVKQFEFTRYFSPRMAQTEVNLDLASELTQIAQSSGANAIIKLKVAVVDIQNRNLELITLERLLGTIGVLFGLSYLSDDSHNKQVTGGIGLAVGTAILGGSFLHESVATVRYTVKVEGTAVTWQP